MAEIQYKNGRGEEDLHCRRRTSWILLGTVPGQPPAPLQGGHTREVPVPYGLVRYGVAPDHPEVKNVINTFKKTGAKEISLV